ncbi:MAG: DUF1569 domain-containing protein [Taibaiella sp.]|nr:DUF1569 domain-containing protein [Taibaiella sp.]
MKNIFQSDTLAELQGRLDNLKPDTQRVWGSMNAAQMMGHCSGVLEIAVGDEVANPGPIKKLFGKLVKPVVLGDKPFKQNLPTDKELIVADERDFIKEKSRLNSLIVRFSAGGETLMNGTKHPLFGKLTATEWNKFTYKHLNHHFRQFGI